MAYTSSGDVRFRHLIQVNVDRSDADFGRTVQHRYRGRQLNGTEQDMALFEVSHEGSQPDAKARCRFTLHNGTSLAPVYDFSAAGTVTVHQDLVVNGNLYVQGTQTTINTETVTTKDKNLSLGNQPHASAPEMDGGGLTLVGEDPKTWTYTSYADAWTSNAHVNVPSGRAYMINNQVVLDQTGLQLPATVAVGSGGLWMAGDRMTNPEGAANPDAAAAGLAPGVLLLGPATAAGSWRLTTTAEALAIERYNGNVWEAKLLVRNQPQA